jgi:hypothetical protein
MRWVIGIVVVAVLVVLGYQYFGPGSEQMAEQAEQPAEPATETAAPAEQPAEPATEEAAQATGEAAETAEQAAETAEPAAGDAAEETAEAGEELAQSSAALVVGDIDLGKELTGVVDRTSDALSGITDVASAEAALPALNNARTKLDDLTPTVEQLPEAAKATLASAVGGMLPELRTLVDQVNGIAGVGEVVKPAVEPIMAKLDAWAKQPA